MNDRALSMLNPPDERNVTQMMTKRALQVADLNRSAHHKSKRSCCAPVIGRGWWRTLLAVPMLKDVTYWRVAIYRQEVRPLPKAIELMKNFAAQSAIAIQNARLLNELRQRTDESDANRLLICVPRRIAWSRPRSSHRSASSLPASPTRSRIRSISSTISRRSRPN